MAAKTTAYVYSNQTGANTLLYTLPNHTASQQSMVKQKRQVPQGNETTYQNTVTFVRHTTDADGNVLPTPYLYEVRERGPVNGTVADRDANIVYAKDLINSDEHANFLNQIPVQVI